MPPSTMGGYRAVVSVTTAPALSTTVARAPEVPKSRPRKSASSAAAEEDDDETAAALTAVISRTEREANADGEEDAVRRRGDGTLEKAVDRATTTPRVSAAAEGLGRGARARETPRPVADASPARATIETADDAATTGMCARRSGRARVGIKPKELDLGSRDLL